MPNARRKTQNASPFARGGISAALVVLAGWAFASPAEVGEQIRSGLIEAQLELSYDRANARKLVTGAQSAFGTGLKNALPAPISAQVIRSFAQVQKALTQNDEAAFAAARSGIWTGILRGSYQNLEAAVQKDNTAEARKWLELREYRTATRFTPPQADATLALEELRQGKIGSAEALTTVRADLLDAYQSRLSGTLRELEGAEKAGYKARRAELSRLSAGYFEILAPVYARERGESALKAARAAFASGSLSAMNAALDSFRAAPLSPRERSKRAGQALRFLSLVPVEYARGVSGAEGSVTVTKDLEITEAVTFRSSAASAWNDLEPLLINQNRAAVGEIRGLFSELEAGLSAASQRDNPPTAEAVQAATNELNSKLQAVIPAEWRKSDPAGDLDVIRQQLKALKSAVAAKSYGLAETARVDAYALLESGSEARLRVFTPQLALDIESLFWNNPEPKGLARLIRDKATPGEVQKSVGALEAKLGEASRFLSADAAPAAVLTNAAVIVFREGLEAVLILAALLGSLKRPEVRRFRRPLWAGAGLAVVGTGITWFAVQGLLTQFARFGERLEAVVSIVAIAVLLVIMNWFFHNVYWTDRLAGFHQQKHRLLGADVGQRAGLVLLGLTALYREGFETVLFLQSLVLQSDAATVLEGSALGLLGTGAVGVGVFLLQARLPYKRMLVLTGVLICAVLFVMVGNTVRVLQLVGWLPIHPLPAEFPYWLGLWAGTYATWEGLTLQAVAVTAVVGSYFAAEGLKTRRLRPAARR